MIYNIEPQFDSRLAVKQYIVEKQFTRVLDVGGSYGNWTKGYSTHFLDINPNLDSPLKVFIGDINDEYGWEEVMQDVIANGKFDFAIASHVLEDIRNPVYVLKKLPQIAKEGYIIGPNKHFELSYVENVVERDDINPPLCGVIRSYRGFCHHRWIMSIQDMETTPVYCLFPKLPMILCISDWEWVNRNSELGELSFWWKDSIKFKVINNDFIGPSPKFIFDLYRSELLRGI